MPTGANTGATAPRGFRITPVGDTLRCEISGLEHLRLDHPDGSAVLITDYPIERNSGVALLAAVLSDGLAPLARLPDNAVCVALRNPPGKPAQLIAARDQVANTPLYLDSRIDPPVVASRVGLLDQLPHHLEIDTLQEYLLFRYTAGPQTLLRGILQPLASHAIVAEPGQTVQHRPYHDLRTMFRTGRFDEVVDQLPDLLRASLARENSFSPLGIMYSGGLDSAFVAHSLAGRPCDLLTLGFPDEGSADLAAAESMPLPAGHRLTTMLVGSSEYASHLPRAIEHFGAPVDHPNFVARDILFGRAAAMGIQRLLSGEGSDTIFGGSWYVALAKALLLKRWVPEWLGRLPFPTARGAQVRRLLGTPVEDLILFDKTYYSQQRARTLAGGLPDGTAHLRTLLAQVHDWDPLDQAFYVAHLTTLSVYPAAHRGMAWTSGVDVGYPFLANAVVRAAASVPGKHRVRRLRAKQLFIPATRGVVPDQIRQRPKYGLAVPLQRFSRDPEGLGRFAPLLTASDSFAGGVLDRDEVRSIATRVITAQHSRDDLELYWVLLNLELWGRSMLRNESVP